MKHNAWSHCANNDLFGFALSKKFYLAVEFSQLLTGFFLSLGKSPFICFGKETFSFTDQIYILYNSMKYQAYKQDILFSTFDFIYPKIQI